MGGEYFEIPALPAADWLPVLMCDPLELEDIFPGMAGPQAHQAIEDMLLEGVLNLGELKKLSIDILDQVTGRTWYVGLNIAAAAWNSWEIIGGELVFRGVRATDISLAAWLDAVYLIIMRNLDQDKGIIFNAKIQVPPPGFEQSDDMLPTAEDFLGMDDD